MFPEYRHLITNLKQTDSHFARLFDKHNELDRKVKKMEEGIERASPTQIAALKKEKLLLKDELYVLLQKAGGH